MSRAVASLTYLLDLAVNWRRMAMSNFKCHVKAIKILLARFEDLARVLWFRCHPEERMKIASVDCAEEY